MSKVRICQRPILKSMKNGRISVREVLLSFNTMGVGRSCLKGGDIKSAELKFYASFFESSREENSRNKMEFAKISGLASLEDKTRNFQFILNQKPLEEQVEYSIDLSEKVEVNNSFALRRSLKLWFSEPKKSEGLQQKDEAILLLLPDDVQGNVGYAEVHVSLFIDGAEEASTEDNDVLDLPLYPLLDGQVIFFIVDVLGDPMADAKVIIKHPNGEEREEVTDARGELHFHADLDDKYELIKIIKEESPDDISQLTLDRMRPDGPIAESII